MSDSKDELRLGDCGIYTQDEIEDTRLECEEIMRRETEILGLLNDKNLQGKVQVEAFNVKPHIEKEKLTFGYKPRKCLHSDSTLLFFLSKIYNNRDVVDSIIEKLIQLSGKDQKEITDENILNIDSKLQQLVDIYNSSLVEILFSRDDTTVDGLFISDDTTYDNYESNTLHAPSPVITIKLPPLNL